MSTGLLTISGGEQPQQVELNARGMILGRGQYCDVIIHDRHLSREHARIFMDPFGRWVIEDLNSSNGVLVGGKRIEGAVVLTGEAINIGPYSLSLSHFPEEQFVPEHISTNFNIIVDEFETEVVYNKDAQSMAANPLQQKEKAILSDLSELTCPSRIYSTVCKSLACTPKTVAVVVRLPKSEPIPKNPDILACHYCEDENDDQLSGDEGPAFFGLAFRVSKSVLETVRNVGEAVMEKSVFSSDTEVTISALDEHSPQAIICVPLVTTGQFIELLYLDVPIDSSARVNIETFDFIKRIAANAASVRKNLDNAGLISRQNAVNSELSLARKMQLKRRPVVPTDLDGFKLDIVYKPVIWVGGDYCNAWKLQDGQLAFAVGKVMDKGLPAAIAIAELHASLKTAMSLCDDPAEIIKAVNMHMKDHVEPGLKTELFLGIFDPKNAKLKYVNAGLTTPIVIEPRSKVVPLGQENDLLLGDEDIDFKTACQDIQQGSRLLFFTRGMFSTKSYDGQEFSLLRLVDLIKKSDDKPTDQLVGLITKTIEDFSRPLPQHDDITILSLSNGQ